MNVQIGFIEEIKEDSIPIIKLTKSKNGTTGTATFIFVTPSIFESLKEKKYLLDNFYLKWESKKIVTKDLVVIFRNGKPYMIKAVFIFKNSKEWFKFLNFITFYSKETGLSFFDSTN